MALRARRFVLVVLVLAASAMSLPLLFLLVQSVMLSVYWDARYGDSLREHKALIDTHLTTNHINGIVDKCSLKKWHVCEMLVSTQKPSIYRRILKFCPVDRMNDEERIIAWAGEQGEVVRSIRVCREPKRLHKNRLAAIGLPISSEAFYQKMESMDFEVCCSADLLNIKNKKYGIHAYDQHPQFYYECKITVDLWLYWETDYDGNIVARGVHDSP